MTRRAILVSIVLACTGAAPAGAAEVVVLGQDAPAWDKPTVAIAAGDTVTWRFDGTTQAHNVRSSGDNWPVPLQSPTGLPAEPASVTFPQLGTFRFLCDVHPDTMVGDVVVGDAPPPPLPPPSQQAYANDSPGPAVLELGGLDGTRPVLGAVRVRRSGRGATVRFVLSEASDVRIRFRRDGRIVRTRRLRVEGSGRLTARGLRAGRYRVELRAWDVAGNASAIATASLRIRR